MSIKIIRAPLSIVVIVSIPCRELYSIVPSRSQTIPGCPRIPTDMQRVVDAAPLHMEVAVPRILPHSVTIIHVNVELSPPLGGSEAVYLLQTQPMFMFETTKAINVAIPAPVEADRSVHASLEDRSSTTLQVTPHVECLPAAGVYGVHTRLPASSVVDVLAAGGSGAGVCAGTFGGKSEERQHTVALVVRDGVFMRFCTCLCVDRGVVCVTVYQCCM